MHRKMLKTYKARLVNLGNYQREGLDYEETFSLVINFTLIRLYMPLFIYIFKWVDCLLDVHCAYLFVILTNKFLYDNLKATRLTVKRTMYLN